MKEKWVAFTEKHAEIWKFIKFTFTGASTSVLELAVFAFLQYVVFKSMNTTPVTDNAVLHFLGILLMCDKEAIEVQKILPFLSDTWPLCRIGRAVIRASQSCRQSCNKSQCPACGCRSHHSCTHAPQFSRSFPAREWGSVLQRQGACGQCP